MSYILEALKKAEAERQLGSAPTIHGAPAVHAAPRGNAASRRPLLIGLGAGVLLASAAAVFTWGHRPAPQVPNVPNVPAAARAVPQAAVPVPVVAPAPAPKAAAEPAPMAYAPPATPARATARESHPRAPVPARPDALTPGALHARAGGPATAQGGAPAIAQGSVSTHAVAPAAPRSLASITASADDTVRPLAELPESIQREVPKVSIGGYIYSPNPADRLLLVDKTLRHEGEEVAPGLVLEKLLPKAAVMNYRGYRYRVAY